MHDPSIEAQELGSEKPDKFECYITQIRGTPLSELLKYKSKPKQKRTTVSDLMKLIGEM